MSARTSSKCHVHGHSSSCHAHACGAPADPHMLYGQHASASMRTAHSTASTDRSSTPAPSTADCTVSPAVDAYGLILQCSGSASPRASCTQSCRNSSSIPRLPARSRSTRRTAHSHCLLTAFSPFSTLSCLGVASSVCRTACIRSPGNSTIDSATHAHAHRRSNCYFLDGYFLEPCVCVCAPIQSRVCV